MKNSVSSRSYRCPLLCDLYNIANLIFEHQKRALMPLAICPLRKTQENSKLKFCEHLNSRPLDTNYEEWSYFGNYKFQINLFTDQKWWFLISFQLVTWKHKTKAWWVSEAMYTRLMLAWSLSIFQFLETLLFPWCLRNVSRITEWHPLRNLQWRHLVIYYFLFFGNSCTLLRDNLDISCTDYSRRP